MNALSLSITSGKVYGSIKLNGNDLTNKVFKKHCYLVEQYDHHWPFLTTKETLTYSAALLLGPGNHDIVVDSIIEKMGLVSCQDTRVGNDFMQGLSGGQKRRLSIGIALLKKPAVILLDEPTSGLDAAGAVAIANELRELAQKEKLIIITTIHQPSTKVYSCFDMLMLLSRGQQAYMGKAKDAENYFASIGHPMEEMTNPAEFVLDLVNADFSSDEMVDKIIDEWQSRRSADDQDDEMEGKDFAPLKNSFHDLTKSRRSFCHKLTTLFRRHALMISRDPILYVGRSVALFFASIFFAIVYWYSRERVQEQVVNYFFAHCWFISVGTLLAVVAVYELNGEFKSVLREVKNGLIHPLAYICAKNVLVLPVMFIFGICGMTVSAYGILGTQSNYGVYLILFSISMYTYECIAEMFSVVSDNPLIGMLSFIGFWFVSFLFAGTFLPAKDIPVVIRWLYYVLPLSNSFSSIGYQAIIDEDWQSCDPSTVVSSVCVDFSIPPNDQEDPGLLVLDAVNRVVSQLSSEDKRLEQMGTLLGISFFAKFVYIGIIFFTSSRATRLLPTESKTEY